jgi:hypothetical protein
MIWKYHPTQVADGPPLKDSAKDEFKVNIFTERMFEMLNLQNSLGSTRRWNYQKSVSNLSIRCNIGRFTYSWHFGILYTGSPSQLSEGQSWLVLHWARVRDNASA